MKPAFEDEELPARRVRTTRDSHDRPGERLDRSTGETADAPAGASADPVGRLHRSAGNQAVGAMLSEVDVSTPDSPAEREADRVASQIVSGGSPAAVSRAAADSTVQRQPEGESKRAEEKRKAKFMNRQLSGKDRPRAAEYEEAAKTTARALLKTPFGKRLRNQAGNMGESFWGTLSGKITTITLAGGAVTGLTVANEELPVQPPSFPVDAILPDVSVPGLRMGVTYEGPVRQPSKVMVSFSYSPGGGGGSGGDRSDSNLGKRLYQFRQSMKTQKQLTQERRLLWEALGGIPPGLSAFKPPGDSMGAPDAGGDAGGEGTGGDEGGGGGPGSKGSRTQGKP